MKKKAKIILAVVLSVVLLLGIGTGITIHLISRSLKTAIEDLSNMSDDTVPASVSETAVPTTEATEPSVSDTTASATTDEQTQMTQAPTTAASTTAVPTAEMPTTGAQTTVLHIPASAVEAFNQATRLSSVKNIVYNREAEKAVFDPDVLNTFFSDKDVKKQNANGLQCATTISELNSSDIANSSIKDNGDAYLLTIILNNAVIPATSEPSQNGYIFFMNYGEIANATHLINEDIEFEKTGSITLSDGKIIAEIDKASGAFKTLSISLHEEYDDEVSKSIIENKIASAPAFVKSAVEKYMKSKGIERILCTLGYNIDASFAF